MSNEKAKALIVVGGFAGLYAAIELDKALARRPGLEVTQVNRECHPREPFVLSTLE
jgi:hypothetical protein